MLTLTTPRWSVAWAAAVSQFLWWTASTWRLEPASERIYHSRSRWLGLLLGGRTVVSDRPWVRGISSEPASG